MLLLFRESLVLTVSRSRGKYGREETNTPGAAKVVHQGEKLKTAENVRTWSKKLFTDTIQELLETEMDDSLGDEKNDAKSKDTDKSKFKGNAIIIMKIKLAPLLNRSASYENESLSSLFYRVGMLNHADKSWLLDVIFPDKKKKVWGSWINRISDPATINKISELTLLTSEEIIRMTTHSFAKIISPGKQKLCLENIKPPLRSTGKYCSGAYQSSQPSKFNGSCLM